MKPFLKKCVITVSGQFGPQKTIEQIEKWITNASGKYETKLSEDTTHLICSEEDWKAKSAKVKNARLKFKKVHVVNFDWLEDSLNKRRALSISNYSFIKGEMEEAKKERLERAREKAKISFVKGCQQAYDDLCAQTYHIYRDPTDYFEYSVTLRRFDLQKKRQETYVLTIYESHAKPHLYATAVKFHRAGVSTSTMLCPMSSFYNKALGQFSVFFENKTGIAWIDRCEEGVKPVGDKDRLFKYTPPTGGKPTGWLYHEHFRKTFATEIKKKAEEEESERRTQELQKQIAEELSTQNWEDPQAADRYTGR